MNYQELTAFLEQISGKLDELLELIRSQNSNSVYQ